MLRKEVFEEIGGFDERLAMAFNDVDLCMRIRRKGYWIVWTPFAALTHYESKKRADRKIPSRSGASSKRKRKGSSTTWRDELRQGDPFYSPNLTLSSEDFALRLQSQNQIRFRVPRERISGVA